MRTYEALLYLEWLAADAVAVMEVTDFLSKVKALGAGIIKCEAWWTVACKGSICIDTFSSTLTDPWVQLAFIDVLTGLSIHLSLNIQNIVKQGTI